MRSAKGYDLYGNIAVVEADPRSAKKIAGKLIANNKNVLTVLRKGGAVRGKYRTRRFFYVAGQRNYLATYRENGCIFRFDVRRVFFSTRLAYERKRIADLVKDGEKVIVMFAGVGPFAIEIAKAHKRCKVIAIEINKSAVSNMKENMKLNKTWNVVPKLGDVVKFAAEYRNFANRIIMPLPGGSANYLPAALKMAGKTCTVHYYTFCPSSRIRETIDSLRRFFIVSNKQVKLLGSRVVRPYSANDVEIAADVLIR